MKKTIVYLIIGVLLLVPLWSCTTTKSVDWPGRKEITLGIKSSKPTEAQKEYEPFLKLITEKINQPATLKAYQSLDELSQASIKGEIDFLLLAPTDYLKLHNSAGVEAIATTLNKGGTPYCQATIITVKGNGITNISDIKGKKFRFGPEGSFNKYYAVLSLFKENNIDYKNDLSAVAYGTGCDGIAQSLITGTEDAGVVCDYSWNGWVDKQSKNPDPDKLQVIGKGPRLREQAFATSKNIDPTIREKFIQALLSLKENQVLLQPPLKARGFVKSVDHDYDDLRQILKELE